MFGKRLWAVRVIDRMGLRGSEPVGAELIDLLISLSKQLKPMLASNGVRSNDGDLVIQAALMAASDSRTAERLVDEVSISSDAASEYLGLLHQAAEFTAVRFGREHMLQVFREWAASRNAH